MKIHGLSKHPLYSVWEYMKARCYNKNTIRYNNYGGRGIRICDEWRNIPKAFIEWGLSNGWQKGLQIDRIDNDGNYEPSNCRFVTNRKNNLNKREFQSNNKTGFVGVWFDSQRNKYQSYLRINGHRHSFGRFDSRVKAAIARDEYIINNNLQHEYKLQVAI